MSKSREAFIKRLNKLHVQLNRLLAAKDAAEKTAWGWLNESK